jgi:uncharacterized RDD family membrane protein YckC
MGMQAEDRGTGLVTPEAVSLNLEIAGVGSRLIGVIVDGVIQGAVLFAGVMAGSASPDFGDGFALVVIGIIFFTLVIYGYQGIFEGLWEGQTPGKKVARTRVVSDNGQPVGWRQVVIRSIFRLIDNSPIGVLTIILTRRSQRLGDLAAGTLVVRDQKVPEPHRLDLAPQPERDELARSLDTSGVTEQEYALIRSFLQRRATLESAARSDVAARLAAPLRKRLGTGSAGVGDEQFLEAVLLSVRARGEGGDFLT